MDILTVQGTVLQRRRPSNNNYNIHSLRAALLERHEQLKDNDNNGGFAASGGETGPGNDNDTKAALLERHEQLNDNDKGGGFAASGGETGPGNDNDNGRCAAAAPPLAKDKADAAPDPHPLQIQTPQDTA